MTTDSNRVLAIGNPGGGVTVLSHRCSVQELEDGDCAPGAELIENYVPLPADASVDQLLTSANGRWLVVRTESQLRIIDLDNPQVIDGNKQFTAIAGPSDAEQLVGSLRTGDWVIYRSPDGLKAYDIAENQTITLSQPDDQFFVAALGDRHIVVRSPAANGGEDLYMLAVDPYRALDFVRSDEPQFLTHTPGRFSEIAITRGATPNDDPHPTDHRIVATASEGEGPVTMVFNAHTGKLFDHFPGKVITGIGDMTSVEGLSAATPDGKAIAYITPKKSLALRDLNGGGSCLVRSERSGRHDLAGFSADGVLFFESHEYDRYSNTQHGRIYGYNPKTGTSDALSPPGQTHRLKAVPPGMVGLGTVENPQDTLTWAISHHGNSRWALQPNGTPLPVTTTDAAYLTRPSTLDDGNVQGLMMVHAQATEENSKVFHYSVGRITARVGNLVDGEYEVDIMDGVDPEVCLETFGHDCSTEPVGVGQYTGVSFHEQAEVCVSTPRVNGWARDCFERATQQNALSPRLLGSEDPYN